MRSILLVLFCIGFSTTHAQYYKTYDWNANPTLHEISSEEEGLSSLIILKKELVQYVSKSIGEPKLYTTTHTITRVNDDKGVGDHNRVYIPMSRAKKLIDVKARTISPNGKVTLLDKANIKEVKNVEEYGDFKIFAIEGVEKGSDIEVLYTLEKNFSSYGVEWVQEDFKVKNATYILIAEGFYVKGKAYRTNNIFRRSSIGEYSGYILEINDIPAVVEEEYSTPKSNRIAVAYQCLPSGFDGDQNIIWTNVSRNVRDIYMPKRISRDIEKEISTIYSESDNLTQLEKAIYIDNYVKNTYSVVKNNNEQLSELDYILRTKTASDGGIVKLYINLLHAAQIEYELVLTANRFLYKFDPDFFVPQMLQDFLIYLPKLKKYIAPDRIESRVGEAPFNILGNYGFFIKRMDGYYLDKVIQNDPDFSRIVRDITIEFSEDNEYVTISENQDYYGHWSETSRAILNLASEENVNEYKDYLTASGIDDKEVIQLDISNEDLNQVSYNVPFSTKSVIKSASLLEEADDSFIFQIGKVIGTQSELYQESERYHPIEMTYPNQYNYTITMMVPKGYSIEGLESLQIKKYHENKDGELTAKFESNYSIENNLLTITIEEFYKTNEYSKSLYETFRGVINAASDFNKAALLITPN